MVVFLIPPAPIAPLLTLIQGWENDVWKGIKLEKNCLELIRMGSLHQTSTTMK